MWSEFVAFAMGACVGLFIGFFSMAFIKVMNDARDRENNK